MFALIALAVIRTGASWHFANCNLVYITRCSSNIQYLYLVGSFHSRFPLPIDQEHPLSPHTIQTFEVTLGWPISETLESLLLELFTFILACPFWFGFLKSCKLGLSMCCSPFRSIVFFVVVVPGDLVSFAFLRPRSGRRHGKNTLDFTPRGSHLCW